jgi:hypothetical protein
VRTEAHQWFGDGAYGLCYTGGAGESAKDMLALCIAEETAVDENIDWASGDVRAQALQVMAQTKMPAPAVELVQQVGRLWESTPILAHVLSALLRVQKTSLTNESEVRFPSNRRYQRFADTDVSAGRYERRQRRAHPSLCTVFRAFLRVQKTSLTKLFRPCVR